VNIAQVMEINVLVNDCKTIMDCHVLSENAALNNELNGSIQIKTKTSPKRF
jgi:hypothetical protein